MGKKVLITESQAKMLLEEVDKNDSIQKLLFCETFDIDFKLATVGKNEYKFDVYVNGKPIEERFVSLLAKKYNIGEEEFYQIYIDVSEELRRARIAFKICFALIERGYKLCMLYQKSTNEFKLLWDKIKKETDFHFAYINDKDGKHIGMTAQKE